MKIQIADRTLSNKGIYHKFELEVSPREPLSRIIDSVKAKGLAGELVYAGKRLSSLGKCTLDDINIQDGSTLHIMTKGGPTFPSQSAYSFALDPYIDDVGGRLSSVRRLAAEYGFDAETHIVEPEAHRSWLVGLKEYVWANSELKMVGGNYDAEDEDFESFGAVNIPDYMVPAVRLAVSISETTPLESNDPLSVSEKQFMSLLKSYLILTRILKTLDDLIDQGFATTYYSFFQERPAHQVAELVVIERPFLANLQQSLEVAIQMLTEDQHIRPYTREVGESISDCLLPVLMSFLSSLCDEAPLIFPESEYFLSRLSRVTILLCDLALVSYVDSHGSKSDEEVHHNRSNDYHVTVQSKMTGVYGFRCDRRRLTCLDGLIDSKKVWVFKLNLEDGVDLLENSVIDESRLSIVTTMERLADIWGPVHAISASDNTSRIIQYNIAKGVIRRSNAKDTTGYKNAVKCHWEDWSSYYGRTVSSFRRLLIRKTPEMSLSPSELLFIGEGDFTANNACTYTLSGFKADYKREFRYPGTKPAEWKSDTRNAAMSISKLVGVSLGLTQKRIPETTVKQRAWHSWSSGSKRQNPMILQHFFGVEVSHCTGNAKKVPLKSFFQDGALIPQLDIQFPRWQTSLWGRRFLQSLSAPSLKAFLQYWKSNERDREHVTELIAYILDLLNDTGASDGKFKAFLAQGGEDYIVPMSIDQNTWAAILTDSDLTAVYSVIKCSCMECPAGLSGPGWSQCEAKSSRTKSYTVLSFQAEVPYFGDFDYVAHDVSRKVFKVDKDESTDETLVLTSASPISRRHAKRLIERESVYDDNDEYRQNYTRNVYIRSSAESFGGMSLPRSSLRHLQGTRGLQQAVQQSWSFSRMFSTIQLADPNSSQPRVDSRYPDNDHFGVNVPRTDTAVAAGNISNTLTVTSHNTSLPSSRKGPGDVPPASRILIKRQRP